MWPRPPRAVVRLQPSTDDHGHGHEEHGGGKKKEKGHHHLDHKHDDRVTSCGYEIEGEFDMELLNVWLRDLLQTRGPDLYRSKGILAISGSEDKWVPPLCAGRGLGGWRVRAGAQWQGEGAEARGERATAGSGAMMTV